MKMEEKEKCTCEECKCEKENMETFPMSKP